MARGREAGRKGAGSRRFTHLGLRGVDRQPVAEQRLDGERLGGALVRQAQAARADVAHSGPAQHTHDLRGAAAVVGDGDHVGHPRREVLVQRCPTPPTNPPRAPPFFTSPWVRGRVREVAGGRWVGGRVADGGAPCSTPRVKKCRIWRIVR
jgi:hypothetical protein